MLVRFLSGSPALAIAAINRSLSQAVFLRISGADFPSQSVEHDQDSLLFRSGAGGAGLDRMRWGFPPRSLTNRDGWNPPISQIHDPDDRWWQVSNRAYVTEGRHRCLIPFSAFAIRRGRRLRWFLPRRSIGFFAGFWRSWEGDTRLIARPGMAERRREQGHLNLFAILATGEGGRTKSDAMPTVLSEPADLAAWMDGGDRFNMDPSADDTFLSLDGPPAWHLDRAG